MSTSETEVIEQAAAPPAEPTAIQNVTTAVAKFDRVAAGLADLKAKYNGVLFDVSTNKGMKDAAAARAAIRGPRVEVEKVRKEVKAPLLALGKEIDARAASITTELLAIEEPIDKQIKAEEERREQEKQRKIAAEIARTSELHRRMQCMRDLVPACVGLSAAAITEQIRQLVASPIDASFQEFEEQADQVKVQVLAKLRDMHTAQLAHEAEQQRLAEERAELARQKSAQEEANRIERERTAKEQAEAKRQRDEQEADRQRLIDEGMAKLRAERAENERLAREQQAQREREDAQRAEQQRVEDERRAGEQRRQQEELQRERELQQARWGEIEAIGHQVVIAITGRAGVRAGATRDCIVDTLAETGTWEITEGKFGPLYGVAISARKTACDAITRELQAWDARVEAQRIAAVAAAAVPTEPVAAATETTESDAAPEPSTSDEPAPAAEFAPAANDIVQLVSSEYGVSFEQALVWCFNAFDVELIAAQRRKNQEGV